MKVSGQFLGGERDSSVTCAPLYTPFHGSTSFLILMYGLCDARRDFVSGHFGGTVSAIREQCILEMYITLGYLSTSIYAAIARYNGSSISFH